MCPNKMIQFLHPGVEHTQSSGEKWNTGPHKRKFIIHQGVYLNNSKQVEGTIRFWAEWEAQSTYSPVEKKVKAKKYYPKGIFEPYYSISGMPKTAANTDPFVFGDFIYSYCRKFSKGKPTSLSNGLVKGDVILFGSNLGGKFVLDTVFVVKDDIEITSANFREKLNGRISQTYIDTVLLPIFNENCSERCVKPVTTLKIHFGATFEDKVDGMYSYVPCVAEIDKINYFKRPVIKIPNIAPNLNTNFKNILRDEKDIKKYWDKIMDQVIKNGLKPAIKIDDVKKK